MTLQRIFDKIVNHLRKQGQQCAKGYECQYRVETGNGKKVLKCAAGCLIPKADYDPAMEGQSISAYSEGIASVYFREKFGDSNVGKKKFKLVEALQGVHDTTDDADYKNGRIEEKFKSVAADFGLTYTPVKV